MSEGLNLFAALCDQKQDQLAVLSNERAIIAQKKGYFKNEIVPVVTKNGDKEVTVSADDGPRAGTTMESLAKYSLFLRLFLLICALLIVLYD